jgi:SAM-dependent methyltransferase
MLIEKIDSENPELHWKYIECNNKIVLDLGCGRWEHIEYRDQSWPTTPQYLADLGASKVYCIDIDHKEIDWYKENLCNKYSNIEPICMDIDSIEKIKQIYNNFSPNVIKCDIEHNEKFLLELSDKEFSSVDFYAIETHSDELYNAFLQRFDNLNYKIVGLLDLIHASPMKVIFAKK